jgi:hypothetical protein
MSLSLNLTKQIKKGVFNLYEHQRADTGLLALR